MVLGVKGEGTMSSDDLLVAESYSGAGYHVARNRTLNM